MKVFNQEVKNCEECNFYNISQMKCKLLPDIDISGNYDISSHCPFNKPLTKEDIESFGFKINRLNNKNEEVYFTKDYILYYIKNSNKFHIIGTKSNYIILKSAIITSKPHLKFILQTLNIIK